MNSKHSVKVDVLIIPLCNRIVIVKIFGFFIYLNLPCKEVKILSNFLTSDSSWLRNRVSISNPPPPPHLPIMSHKGSYPLWIMFRFNIASIVMQMQMQRMGLRSCQHHYLHYYC